MNMRTFEKVSVAVADIKEWLTRIQMEKGYRALECTDVFIRNDDGEFVWRAPFLFIHLITGTESRLTEWPKE